MSLPITYEEMISGINSFNKRGHAYIFLNAIQRDFQIFKVLKVSKGLYVVHLIDCHNRKNYKIVVDDHSYDIVSRWK